MSDQFKIKKINDLVELTQIALEQDGHSYSKQQIKAVAIAFFKIIPDYVFKYGEISLRFVGCFYLKTVKFKSEVREFIAFSSGWRVSRKLTKRANGIRPSAADLDRPISEFVKAKIEEAGG